MSDALTALSASLERLLDEEAITQYWLRFTDDQPVPEGTEKMAELGFKAGYATAINHVESLLATLSDAGA